MLLEKKNGTIWSLTPRPSRKVINALNGNLEPTPFRRFIIVLTISAVAILTPLIYSIFAYAANQRALTIIMLIYIVILVVGFCVALSRETRPIYRQMLLGHIVNGDTPYDVDYIHERHFGFQLLAPLIERAKHDKNLSLKISEYFRKTEHARAEMEHLRLSTSCNSEVYRHVCDKQLIMLEKALLLADSIPDASGVRRQMQEYVDAERQKAQEGLLNYRSSLEKQINQIDAVLTK